MRLRAIFCALKFGLLPSRFYEKNCHYKGMSYREHMQMNLGIAWRWLTFTETHEDQLFEANVNRPRPSLDQEGEDG